MQFLAWLEIQGEVANSARLCQQALYLTRQVTTQDAKQRCGAGEEAGPQTENHTRRAKKGKQQGQGVAGDAFVAAGRPPLNQRSRAPTRGGPGQQYGSRSPDHIPRQEWAQKLLTEEGSKEIRKTAEARTGPCPVCRDPHVYNRRMSWGSISWPSSRLQDCGAFRALSHPQRARVIEELRGCATCLSWTHLSPKCPLKEPKNPSPGTVSLRCQEREGTRSCGRAHHRMLHGSNAVYASENSLLGAPRGFGASRPDLFAGRPMGSNLAEGTAGATFEIVEAPVKSVE